MFKKILLSLAIGSTLLGGTSGIMLASNNADTAQEAEAKQTEGEGTVSDGNANDKDSTENMDTSGSTESGETSGESDKKDGDNSTESPSSTSANQPTNTEQPTQNAVTRTETEGETPQPEIDSTKGKIQITINPEKKGWFNETASIKVEVTKVKVSDKFQIDKVEAKAGANGSWQEITDEMLFEITENCNVYVKVTDQDGNEYEKSRYIKCFDRVAPTLNAAVNEGLLTVMTYDTESGVKDVYINEYRYQPDKNGIISIRLQKFDASYQYFYVYALDKAGNASQVYTISNPYWTDPNAEKDDDEEKANPADSLPDNAQAQTTGTSSAEVTSVTNQDGEDITEEIDTKQFYSIVTADGQQYFLVIDMTAAKSGSGEENASVVGEGANVHTNQNGTVYFLTSVTNQNLLNFANDGEQTLPYNSVARQNNIDDVTKTGNMDESAKEKTTEEEPKQEEKEEKSASGTLLYIIIFAVVAAGVVGFKVLTGKKGKPEISDDELYNGAADEDEEVPLSELEEQEEDVE